MKGKVMAVTIAAFFAVLFTHPAEAKHHYRHYGYHSSGACDGFNRCRCGTTAARKHGLPYDYNGFNLKQASEWRRAFPATSFHVGAVGVKPHHVLTIVGGNSCSAATVYDDAGTYQRNVCGMTFVEVSGGSRYTAVEPHSRRSHRHRTRVAYYEPSDYMARSGAGL